MIKLSSSIEIRMVYNASSGAEEQARIIVDRSALRNFYSSYVQALAERRVALFVGAGFSQPSGAVDWRHLKSQLASSLKIGVDTEPDLLTLAQYFENSGKSQRSLLVHRTQLATVSRAALTENHRLITGLPVRAVWSSGYDNLIEQAYQNAGQPLCVKVYPEDFINSEQSRAEPALYKMLGDLKNHLDVVLTKADHELYDEKRGAFTEQFKKDLLSKTFLFLGIDFDDPHFNYILSRMRALLGNQERVNYCVIKVPGSAGRGRPARGRFELEKRFNLRITDLQRQYGIQSLVVSDCAEVTEILRELNRRKHFRRIFVSGSIPKGATEENRDSLILLARQLGREIMTRGYHLVYDTEMELSAAALHGALEVAYGRGDEEVRDRLCPFPRVSQQSSSAEDVPQAERGRDDFPGIGFVIFLGGDSLSPSSQPVSPTRGSGRSVLSDFEAVKKAGVYPLAVGSTGLGARQIWEEVGRSLRSFPGQLMAGHYATLKKAKRANREIIEAIFAIIENTISSP